MRLWFAGWLDRMRSSLFVVPMLSIVGAIVLGEAMIALDRRLGRGIGDLPLGFTSTVESARAVVSTIAGATITVAGIAFSISILIFQLASSQYSPRVIHGLFRDPFNKRVMGLVAGTFTYCLIVLRSIRSAVDSDGEAVIPNTSVAVAVILGIAALLAIVAFINHSAHSMDVSRILRVVTDDTLRQIERNWPEPGQPEPGTVAEPDEPGLEVRAETDGWVDRIDEDALVEVVPPGGLVTLAVHRGDYVLRGQMLARLWPLPEGSEKRDEQEKRARRSVHIGPARSTDEDPAYGLRQLVDVALKALSPSVNDPTTAQDAIFHIATVLGCFAARSAPPRAHMGEEGRRLQMPGRPGHAEMVDLAFDELRLSAAPHPRAVRDVLQAMGLVAQVSQNSEVRTALARHVDLVVEAAMAVEPLASDRKLVQDSRSRVLQVLGG